MADQVFSEILSPKAVKALSRDHPAVRGAERALLAGGSEESIRVLAGLHEQILAEEDIVNRLVGDRSSLPVHPDEMDQLHRKAALKARFLDEVETFTSRELSVIHDGSTQNPSALANRWKRAGRVFAVNVKGEDRYPSFQFVDGLPISSLRDVLAHLSGESPWNVALWFISPNDWLDGKAPAEMLRLDPTRVVRAAR